MSRKRHPLFIINAWPDPHLRTAGLDRYRFAGHGKIFNIGVYPYAEVQIAVYADSDQEERIIINAENYVDRYAVHPARPPSPDTHWDKHPLLEAAIEYMRIPEDYNFEVTIYSEAPTGASTGTSAAVTVALIGGLDNLTPGRLTAHQVALTAQRIETEMLGQQCGIQDQLCSAYGGLNYIEMFNYPHASVSPIQIPNTTWWELERRVALIYLGRSHQSSKIHDGDQLKRRADCIQPKTCGTAEMSRALFASDFTALGQAMIANTQAQRLHPALVSRAQGDRHRQEHGALG
jgi:D-glycero-alpha-D-manno-heptose-7-phosphate kinase